MEDIRNIKGNDAFLQVLPGESFGYFSPLEVLHHTAYFYFENLNFAIMPYRLAVPKPSLCEFFSPMEIRGEKFSRRPQPAKWEVKKSHDD